MAKFTVKRIFVSSLARLGNVGSLLNILIVHVSLYTHYIIRVLTNAWICIFSTKTRIIALTYQRINTQAKARNSNKQKTGSTVRVKPQTRKLRTRASRFRGKIHDGCHPQSILFLPQILGITSYLGMPRLYNVSFADLERKRQRDIKKNLTAIHINIFNQKKRKK